jgi:hypothetical protein
MHARVGLLPINCNQESITSGVVTVVHALIAASRGRTAYNNAVHGRQLGNVNIMPCSCFRFRVSRFDYQKGDK